jgi:uncharacterized protein
MHNIETNVETGIETPCTRVCAVHPTLRLCIGCGRSLEEIAGWVALSERERARLMREFPQRLAAMRNANAARTTA